MFCPICKCEFRTGFTRCEGCDADLVEDLDASPAPPDSVGASRGRLAPDLSGRKADYCGFLEMQEARAARDRLWETGIVAEIAVRPVPGSIPGGTLEEEFWLRVPADQVKRVMDLLGFHEGDGSGIESAGEFQVHRCERCGAELPPEEEFCPHCGAVG